MTSTSLSPPQPLPTNVRLSFSPNNMAPTTRTVREKTMKKRQELQGHDQDQLEILKAVAQAWHAHSGCYTRPTNEFDAYKRNFKSKPTRFKLEAISNSSSKDPTAPSARWDFGQSLWDSYEIVTVSKRLEVGLVLDDPFQDSYQPRVVRRRRESNNSLRNLFTRVSSKRFKDTDIPPES